MVLLDNTLWDHTPSASTAADGLGFAACVPPNARGDTVHAVASAYGRFRVLENLAPEHRLKALADEQLAYQRDWAEARQVISARVHSPSVCRLFPPGGAAG
jgi:hypothetical protein